MKIKTIVFCLLIFILCIGYFFEKKYINNQGSLISVEEPVFIGKNISTDKTSVSQSKTSKTLPLAHQIENVPFEPQAPFANWDHLHDEACEEASLAITDFYLKSKKMSPEIMEDQIQKMIAWEGKNWDQNDKDLTVAEVSILAKDFYGLNPTLKKISSLDDIKKEISVGHLVIVPAAGRLLGNPNFRNPGPIYHMVVITGFTNSEIITNDVGTRKGLNYRYPNSIFWNAIHDWNGTQDTINNGQKVMLVF